MPRSLEEVIDVRSVRVVLDLSFHCVQTAARKEHARLEQLLLAGRPELEAQERLMLLGEFLESTDFKKLRAERPELAGGTPVQLEVWRTPSGGVEWSILGLSGRMRR